MKKKLVDTAREWLENSLLGGAYASAILFGLGFIVAFYSFPRGMILISLAVAYIAYVAREIKEPEVGALFKMGRLVKILGPGWHFPLVPIHNIQTETTARQQLNSDNPDLEKADLYYISEVGKGKGDRNTRKIAVTVRMRVFFQLHDPLAAIRAYGGLGTEASRKDIYSTTLSALRAAVGRSDLTRLLSEKEELEEEIQNLANAELAKGAKRPKEGSESFDSGYRVHVDIYDIDENVQSAASKMMEEAEAEVFRAGEIAKAMAEPLKDNYPAAIAQSVTVVANTLRNTLTDLFSSRKEQVGQSAQTGDKNVIKQSEIESLLEQLRGGAA